MVSVLVNDLAQVEAVSYERWNAALARAFFNRNRAGELVYLDKDDAVFADVCSDVGVTAELADVSLAHAVRNELCWKESGRATFANFDMMTKLWVARRRKALRESSEVPAPPHIALLMLFSSAAERVGGANSDTGSSESSYYSSLETLLAVPASETGRFRMSFMRSSEAFWESLSLWLEDQDGVRGMPSAYALMHRYVGLPISQALVRERERRNLKKMFEEQGFIPGTTVSQMDMHGAIDVWISSARTSANTALRKMWASDEIKNRIVEIALAEFATWEGLTTPKGEAALPASRGIQRGFLTLRDSRVMLRSEMRFGLMLAAGALPGQSCRVVGLEGEEREFPLDPFGVASAGFDFRAVGIDVASAIQGELRLETESSQSLRRLPKKVVILTQDPYSAAYIESDRINAAVLSRIVVEDEPFLVSAIEKILADAAQPGHTKVLGGEGGVPHGWVVFKDVTLLRAPKPGLVAGPDLSAFEPRLSTQMTITGGLKLPGHMQRWSALSPIQVVIASESDDPVDLVIVTRNEETLQSEEMVFKKGITVPAVADLNDLPGSALDFTLALRRGKNTVQTLAVKLRSSRFPSPDASKRFRSLCHDLDDPVWPVQCVPLEKAGTPGVDGIAVSAPVVDHAFYKVENQPSWNAIGKVGGRAKPLVVAGPPENSCIATGRHRFDFPTFDGKRPKAQWMYGVCTQCGMSKRQPTRIAKKSLHKDLATARVRETLPPLTSRDSRWEPLIDALFYLGAGSRREFSVLARQVEDTAIFENQLLLNLEALGVIELERNAELEVIQWESAASCIGELADGRWLLTGYWNQQLRDQVTNAAEELAGSVRVQRADRQAMAVIDGITATDMSAIAEEFDVDFVPQAASTLARALPPLSTVGAGLRRSSMPFANVYEFFDPRSASWQDVETAALPGLYRVSHSFSSRYYYRTPQDVAANTAAIVTVQLGKHLAASHANRPLVAYDPGTERLSVPVGAELPGLYGRAAVIGSGDLPTAQASNRSIIYSNVPAAAAQAIIGKLMS